MAPFLYVPVRRPNASLKNCTFVILAIDVCTSLADVALLRVNRIMIRRCVNLCNSIDLEVNEVQEELRAR